MASSLLDQVERLHTALDYHLARHNVLVSNLAQVDTPGYRPVDLARADFDGQLNVALSATDPGHVGSPADPAHDFRVVSDPTTSTSADGNGVDVDREAVKIATNQMRYDTLAQLASSQLQTLDWAATDAKSGG